MFFLLSSPLFLPLFLQLPLEGILRFTVVSPRFRVAAHSVVGHFLVFSLISRFLSLFFHFIIGAYGCIMVMSLSCKVVGAG